MDAKTIRIIGISVLIIILGAAAYFMFGNPPATEAPANGQQVQETREETIRSSVMDLLGSGRNIECTFSAADENGTTEGHVYLAGNKMYGEFATSANGQNFDGYVINDGEYSYTWSSQSNQGTKIKISDVETTDSTQEDDTTSQTLEEDVDLKCGGWTVDSSKFTPPSDVEFVDLTTQLEQTQQNVPQVENLESVCDQLAGESKQQCLDALNNQ